MFGQHPNLNNKKQMQWLLNGLNILGIVLTVLALYYGYQAELFTSEMALREFLQQTGAAAPFVFIFIQIVQTVIPIIPGALTIPMGTMIFGMGFGFLLNFIGVMIGSIINFYLARRYGRSLVEMLVGEKKMNKYTHWLDDKQRFDKLFTFGMFFPFSPGDFLCYLAGLSSMSWGKYLLILTLGKPFTLFVYSYGMTEVLQFFFELL